MPTVGCFSYYAEEAILLHVFNKETLAVPYIYIGLCAASPGEAGTGANCNEVPDAYGYERATVYYWSDVMGGFVENSAEILFPEAVGGGWGTASHFALFNIQTYGAGDMLIYGSLVAPREILSGSIPKFAIGEIGIQLD